MTVTNCTISDNLTGGGVGGGIQTGGIAAIVRHTTITDNRASGGGGGTHGPITFNHTIVAGNFRTFDEPDDVLGAPGATFSQIGMGEEFLGPLADNGGPTMTHALLAGSPAIDAGDPNFDPADPDGDPLTDDAVPYDQRGAPFGRVSGGRIDIGAFELQVAGPALPGDYNGDGAVNAADYAIWRDTLGSTTDLRANGDDSNNVIDTADYGVWTSNFGDTPGAGVGQAVPDVSDLRQAQPDLPALATNHAEVDRGTDTPVRPSIYGSLNGGQECPPHDTALMLALLDLLALPSTLPDHAEFDAWILDSDATAEREAAFAGLDDTSFPSVHGAVILGRL